MRDAWQQQQQQQYFIDALLNLVKRQKKTDT
jgi:hypothetical protein